MFSVIIPAYNCEKTIEQVLDSVKNQTRIDLIEEIIIINDGSTDETHSVICEYMNSHRDLNIVYLQQTNSGVSCARNRAIKIAKAEWIALLDSDDVWHLDKTEKQYNEIKKNKDIVFLGADGRFDNNSGTIIKINAKQLCIKSTPDTSSVVFNKNIGIEYGLFDEKMKYSEDINFFQKFLLRDSYFIITEDLVDNSIGKSFYGQSGLSSNLYQMQKGRNINTKQLYEMKLINFEYYCLMIIFNWIKFFRRVLLYRIYKTKISFNISHNN